MTGGELGVLWWLIKADSKQYEKTVKDTEKTASSANKKVEKSFVELGATMAIAKGVFDQIAAGVGELINAYAVQEQAEKRLGAVITATGHAAGFTLEEMKAMAEEMQSVTTFGDEMVLGAQAILATFKSISGDIFPRTIEAAADLSAVFGQSLQQSTTMLGKALEDPIAGMGALRRVGVTLSAQTQKLVKDFVALGDVEAAQNEILKAVEGQVKGTARAMATEGTGSIIQFENAVGDLKEELGKLIVDTILPAVKGLTDFKDAGSDLIGVLATLLSPLTGIVKLVGEQIQLYSNAYNGIKKLVTGEKEHTEEIIKSTKAINDHRAASAELRKEREWKRAQAKKEAAEEEERLEKVQALREEYADKYRELQETELERLKAERDAALERAEEIGAGTYEIRRYYKALIKEEEEQEEQEQQEKEEEQLEKERDKHQERLENRRAGEKLYTEYMADQTKKRNELSEKAKEEEKKRQEELRKEYEKTAATVIGTMGDIVSSTVKAAAAGEDAWDALKKASLEAIASAVRGLSKEFAVRASGYYAFPPTIPLGVAFTAASIAAAGIAALIPSLDTGGMLKKDSLIQAHKGEIVMPLDDAVDRLAEKLSERGMGKGGDIYFIIHAGNLNTEMDIERVLMQAGEQLQQTIRSF
jgi:hypothetical protein